jgi:hypothetical protein
MPCVFPREFEEGADLARAGSEPQGRARAGAAGRNRPSVRGDPCYVVRMRITALLLATLLAAGCKSEANKKFDALADKACECQDAECALKVALELAALAKESEGKPGDNEAALKSIGRAQDCIVKAKKLDKGVKQGVEKLKEAAEKAKAGDKADEKAGDK